MASMTVWGVVNANGTVAAGSGFTVTSQGSGEYIISFSPAFSSMPAIVGSQANFGSTSQDTRDNIVFPYVNNGAATALTGDSGGNHTNRSFSFIAMGPA